MPTMKDNTEKPSPAPDHVQDISSIMNGNTTPRDENVAAVIWKKIALTSANLSQPCQEVSRTESPAFVSDIRDKIPGLPPSFRTR